MPRKTESNGKDNSTKILSFDDVSYLVAKLEASKVPLGAKDYQNMAKLNGTRSEHGYNHLFRGVKARGKELVPMITGGDIGEIKASPAKGAGGTKVKAEPDGETKVAKRRRKARSERRPQRTIRGVGKSNKKVKTEETDAGGEAEADAEAGEVDIN